MRKFFALVFMVCLFLAGGCATYPIAPLDMARMSPHERMVNSVVVLPGCTGIVLRNMNKNAVILTAAHCVRRFQAKLPNGSDVTLPIPIGAEYGKEAVCIGKIGAVSRERDLALITVEKCALPTAVALLAQKPPKVGETVYAVGHPLAHSYVLTKGIVSRPEIMFDNTVYLLISAPVIFGNSGGPCFNTRGEVIGVVTDVSASHVRMEDGKPFPLWYAVPHLGMAAPLKDIKQFLRVGGFPELVR